MSIDVFFPLLMITLLTGCAVAAYRMGRGRGRPQRVLGVAVALCLVYGAVAFFAPILGSTAPALLPASFQWPVAQASGVVRDAHGHFIVPVTDFGRIQVYTPDKRFLRGWQIDAQGGVFKLHMTDDDLIEVFSARGDGYALYTIDGACIQQGTYAPTTWDQLPAASTLAVWIPTPWPLLPLTHPMIGWVLVVAGMCGFAYLRNSAKKSASAQNTVAS